jgi:TonB family protein
LNQLDSRKIPHNSEKLIKVKMKLSRFAKALIASVLIHALWAFSSIILPSLIPDLKTQRIEIELVEPEPQIKPEKLIEPETPKQIVDQEEKPVNDEIDENAKYLSQNNQKVIKETVAKNRGEFKNRKSNTRKGETKSSKSMSIKDMSPQMDISKLIEEKLQFEKDYDDGLLTEKTDTKQKPAEQPQSGGEVSQTEDYLKDQEESVETLLSTKEFVYYTFYNRIRAQLNQYWQSKVREKFLKLLHTGRNIASGDDKITKLLITLDRKGNLVRVQVLSDSGVKDLDDAAIEAFRAAAPFPNPPEGIVESDGTIKIRWDMIIET